MTLTSNQRNWVVFFGAIAATAIAAAVYLSSAGANDDNIRLTLRLSARAAYLLLLVVFIARPLRQLVKTPLTLALLKNRRLLGVAFAGIHTAHLGLIFYRADMVADFELSIGGSLLGVFTYSTIYAMFATSFDATTRAIGPRNWRVLHKAGLYWIMIAFVPTLLPESPDQLFSSQGVLTVLAAAALVIRLTAFFVRRKAKEQPQ